MKNNELNIGFKTILICTFLIMGVISTIFILNNYDNKRKSVQTESIYTQIEASPYIDDLHEVVNRLDSNSIAITNEINTILQSIKLNIPAVDYCILYVKKDGRFIEFTSYRSHKKGIEKNNILVEDERIYAQIKNSNDRLLDLKLANKEIRNLKTCHLLNDDKNEYSFLIVTSYRN